MFMRFVRDNFFEIILVLREKRIPFLIVLDEREIELVDERQRLAVNLPTTTDEYLIATWFLSCFHNGVLDRGCRDHSFVLPRRVARDDDIRPIRQRLSEHAQYGFKRLAPHDDGMPERKDLEALQIIRNMPEKLIILSKNAIAPDCRDSTDLSHCGIIPKKTGALWGAGSSLVCVLLLSVNRLLQALSLSIRQRTVRLFEKFLEFVRIHACFKVLKDHAPMHGESRITEDVD
jgi:hypothetical protein